MPRSYGNDRLSHDIKFKKAAVWFQQAAAFYMDIILITPLE